MKSIKIGVYVHLLIIIFDLFALKLKKKVNDENLDTNEKLPNN